MRVRLAGLFLTLALLLGVFGFLRPDSAAAYGNGQYYTGCYAGTHEVHLYGHAPMNGALVWFTDGSVGYYYAINFGGGDWGVYARGVGGGVPYMYAIDWKYYNTYAPIWLSCWS